MFGDPVSSQALFQFADHAGHEAQHAQALYEVIAVLSFTLVCLLGIAVKKEKPPDFTPPCTPKSPSTEELLKRYLGHSGMRLRNSPRTSALSEQSELVWKEEPGTPHVCKAKRTGNPCAKACKECFKMKIAEAGPPSLKGHDIKIKSGIFVY